MAIVYSMWLIDKKDLKRFKELEGERLSSVTASDDGENLTLEFETKGVNITGQTEEDGGANVYFYFYNL